MFLFLSLWHALETINSLSLSCLVVWLAVGCPPHTHTRTRLLSLSVYGKQRLFGNVSSYDSGPLTWDIDAHELSFLLFGSNQTYLFRLHSRLIRFLIVFIYVGNIVVCFFPSFIFHLLCFILSSNHVCCSFLSLKIAPFLLFYFILVCLLVCSATSIICYSDILLLVYSAIVIIFSGLFL